MEDFVPTSLFWFTLALINAGLAEQKGRSRLNWFLISLFIGPVATLLVVVWDRPATTNGSFTESLARHRAARELSNDQNRSSQ